MEKKFELTAEEVGLTKKGLEYYKENCEGMLNTLPEYLTDHQKKSIQKVLRELKIYSPG